MKIKAIKADEAALKQQQAVLETTKAQMEVFEKEVKYVALINDCKEQIKAVENKLSVLRESR